MSAYAILICLLVAPVGMAKTPAEMEPVLARIATYEHGQSREALIEFDRFVRDEPAQRPEIEKRLVRFLGAQATPAGKDYVCRQLSLIGTAASVPALAELMRRSETFEMARYALERIPSPAADEALRKAVAGTSGKMKAGVIDSLGRRRDARAVAVLKPLLTSTDAAVADSAATALGQIGSAQAAKALGTARGKVPAALKARISEAYVRCAERMAESGDKAGAIQIYKQLIGAPEDPMIRIAALGGLAAAAGKDAVPSLAEAIVSENPKVQAASIRFLNRVPGPEATAVLVRAYEGLPTAAQVVAVSALADRGDVSARPLVVDAASGGVAEVRAAALAALAKLGDGSTLGLLAEAAAMREGREQAAARESLYRLRGADVDSAIVKGVSSAAGNARVELIRAAGERGLAAATEALIASARDADREVRRESVRALRGTAAPAHAQALLDLLPAAQGTAERREAGRTLSAVLRKTDRPDVSAVIAAYSAAKMAPMRALLLEVLGQVAAEEALPVLRSGLNESEREVSRAAILALSDWPTDAPMADLLGVAKSAPSPAHQVLALRGFIKQVSAPAGRPAEENARLLGEAMGLARQPEEKKAVLALLPRYPCREAARIAEDALKDPAVATEAKAAAERITRALETRR